MESRVPGEHHILTESHWRREEVEGCRTLVRSSARNGLVCRDFEILDLNLLILLAQKLCVSSYCTYSLIWILCGGHLGPHLFNNRLEIRADQFHNRQQNLTSN